jgi:hypothetical protein
MNTNRQRVFSNQDRQIAIAHLAIQEHQIASHYLATKECQMASDHLAMLATSS